MKKRIRKSKSADPEIPAIRRLKEVPPEIWAEEVLKLDPEIRPQVARVIWWDWFAGREVGQRWSHLDCYLRPRSAEQLKAQLAGGWDRQAIADAEFGRDLSKDEMAAALTICGYPPNYAKKRA